MDSQTLIKAGSLADIQAAGCTAVHLNGHTIALFAHQGKIFATDNRCPHMGFPLDRGSVKDGILTCHWHHARFDLASGGTFDQWADDVRAFPVVIRDGEVWVDVAPRQDPAQQQRQRLRVGLERDLPLVIGKAVLTLHEVGGAVEPFREGLQFGTAYRRNGWGQGLTILTCMMNLVPHLAEMDKPRALYQGLSAVARESFGSAPRFAIQPLPNSTADSATLKRWLRQFIEVRDAEGAERCIVSAIRAGHSPALLADMLFAAVTDHRYIQTGHAADFVNKALEALDVVGWELAEPVLTSLVNLMANAERMEESNAWRNPVDLIALLETAFEALPQAVANGRSRREGGEQWNGRFQLTPVLLGDNPQAIISALLEALAAGYSENQLAQEVSYTAALRIARFHTSNEFGDWDTALHTFTFANAIQQGLRRAPSLELLRGVFDAAMSVYLDRFLNIPAARLPQPEEKAADPAGLLEELTGLLDRQQQVNEAGQLVGRYLHGGGSAEPLLALLGGLLLREDRDFHTIQTVETAVRQYHFLQGTEAGCHVLIAAARYLAAHAPTVRAQGQTYQIAQRLHRGDALFQE